AAQVEIHTAAAQGWASRAHSNGIFCRHDRYTLGAHQPDGIAGEQVFVLVDLLWKITGKVAYPVEKSQRRLERDSAYPEIRGHHALSADHLEDLQDLFTLAETIQEDR